MAQTMTPIEGGVPMTKEELEHLIYEEVEADIETEADAKNAFQEGYSVGFNDCRWRVLHALLDRLSIPNGDSR